MVIRFFRLKIIIWINIQNFSNQYCNLSHFIVHYPLVLFQVLYYNLHDGPKIYRLLKSCTLYSMIVVKWFYCIYRFIRASLLRLSWVKGQSLEIELG